MVTLLEAFKWFRMEHWKTPFGHESDKPKQRCTTDLRPYKPGEHNRPTPVSSTDLHRGAQQTYTGEHNRPGFTWLLLSIFQPAVRVPFDFLVAIWRPVHVFLLLASPFWRCT